MYRFPESCSHAVMEITVACVQIRCPSYQHTGVIQHGTTAHGIHVLGTRQDEVFRSLKVLGAPFGMRRFYMDGADVYERHIDSQQHMIGKTQTQRIERNHLTL
jgi:hypothetical protein